MRVRLNNFKGMTKVPGLHHEIRWNVKFLDYYREAVTDTRQQALVACERDLH
jgi:hypothetical protein